MATLHIEREHVNDIVESLKKEGRVRIAGIGTFKIRQMKARKARNPKTGESVDVPAKKKVAFKASPELLEAVK